MLETFSPWKRLLQWKNYKIFSFALQSGQDYPTFKLINQMIYLKHPHDLL